MPWPNRVPAIRDDSDPVSASGKQSAAPREQVALASCLEASHSLRTVGKGDGVGAVVDVEVRRRTHQPVL